MPRDKVSIIAAAARVRQEGIGYAVQHYMRGEDIEDHTLATLWDRAAQALDDLESFFAHKLGEDWRTASFHLHDVIDNDYK